MKITILLFAFTISGFWSSAQTVKTKFKQLESGKSGQVLVADSTGSGKWTDLNADWIESNPNSPSFIKNKPVFVTSVADEIIKLKSLLDSGIITQKEYDAQKKKLLSN